VALAHVHATGVAHGAVDPHHVRWDLTGRPTLVDAAAGPADVTYQAPEARRDQPSVAADLWSLCATLHALLAGSPPFGPAGPRSGAAPPDLRELGVPNELATAIEHGLAAMPADRPANALALARALQGVQFERGLEVTGIEIDLVRISSEIAPPVAEPAPAPAPQPPARGLGPPAHVVQAAIARHPRHGRRRILAWAAAAAVVAIGLRLAVRTVVA
jgi:serine/threonine-protein kinase PknK